MMSVADIPAQRPFWLRLFLAIPVIGWVARDLMFGDKNNVYFALIGFVSAWMCATITFGLPGLYLPALALVPVMFVLLVVYAWG